MSIAACSFCGVVLTTLMIITLASGELPLTNEHDIVLSRQAVRRMAQEQGFSLVDQTKLVTAASELARNAVVYGGGGVMQWGILLDGVKRGLKLAFQDKGPRSEEHPA